MDTPPVMPRGVVVHKASGPVPCELTYRGTKTEEDGVECHVWSCPTLFEPLKGDSITVEFMPGLTGIHFGEKES